MITIYEHNEENFASLGMGALSPIACDVVWEEGGQYDLTLQHPIMDDGKWMMIANERILRVPSPVRESPYVEFTAAEQTESTISREIYKVSTPKGGRLNMRQGAGMNARILTSYKPGTEVEKTGQSGDWTRVIVLNGGKTGWMYTAYLKYVRTETETVVTQDKPGVIIKRKQAGDQLFRINKVDADTTKGVVNAEAQHISYDLKGVRVIGKCDLKEVPVETALSKVLSMASRESDFEIHCAISGNITGDYTNKSILECLRDPKIGFAVQLGARVVCDNFDVWLIPSETRDMGVTLRRGKNLTGVNFITESSDRVSRIYPVGSDKDGNPLYLSGTKYIESPYAGAFPGRDAAIEYDVKVGDGDDEYRDNAAAQAELKKRAQADMDSGADAEQFTMNVQFIDLGDTEEYKQYRELLIIHPYDTVTVIRGDLGRREKARLNKCTWDSIVKKYKSVTLGSVQTTDTTVYSFNIASGAVGNGQIAANAVGTAQLRQASIQYAKISVAAIEQLAADAITAVSAHINQLVAGTIETDQLYADLAAIAMAEITTANIDKANIDWAQITSLSAQVAEIAKAQIESADIDWANIHTLSAVIADIAQARIDSAKITSAQITDLNASVAEIAQAQIAAADIGFGQIKDLVAGNAIITQGVSGQLYISRLAVTEANMVSLSVGELIIKGSDGGFYALGVDEAGNITTTLKQIGNSDVADMSINAGEKIIEGTITAATLNVNDIFADSAIIRELIAENFEVDTLWNREAWISKINGLGGSLDLSANESIRLMVKDLEDKKSTIYRQDAAPDTAKDSDIWVQPSTGRTWQFSAEATGAPIFALSDDGQLAYAYADGDTVYPMRIDENGYLQIVSDAPFGLSPDDVSGSWRLIVDVDEINNRLSETESEIVQTNDRIALAVTRVSSLENRMDSAEVAIKPDSIAAVVKQKVAFGGTNLALNSAFQGLTGAGVYSFDGDEAVFSASSTGATSDVYFRIDLSSDIAQARGREITFSMDYRVDSAVSYGTTSPWVGAQIVLARDAGNSYLSWLGGSSFPTAVTGKWVRAASTFTLTDDAISSGNIIFMFRDAAGTVRLRHPKLEIGNVATEWSPSPEDPGQSLNTYSGVYINRDEIHLVSEKTTVAVPGENGEDDVARFDAEGVHAQIIEADEINSPSVVATQGAETFAPANAGELAAIAENLKNVCLTGAVTIDASALTGGTMTLRGVSGGFALTVSGGTINSAEIIGCSARIVFSGVTMATSGAAVTAETSQNVQITGGALNAGTGVLAKEGSRVRVSGCSGACDYAADSRGFSEVTFTGATPGTDMPYGLARFSDGGQVYAGARLTAKPSAEPEPEKPTVQTVTLTPTLTRTYDSSWREGFWLWQGRYGTRTLNRGCMWFDTSEFAGKTILSASLSLKRMSGAGSGVAVAIKICGTTAAGVSGAPAVGAQYASVSIAQGARKSVDVTNAVKALADGSIKGLMLYDSSTTNMSSSNNYTACYVKVYGYDSPDRPVLTVTYQ